MCGRYRLSKDLEALLELFTSLLTTRAHITPRFNIAPTQQAPVVVRFDAGEELRMMSWGLVPSWAKDTKGAAGLINARSETAADKPSFRAAFKRKRCLVPANGFYEWEVTPDGKQPWHIGRKDGALFCFAGLWESWKPTDAKDVETLQTFTILTTEPNALVSRIHDRMPVILPREAFATWLDAETPREALQPLLVPFNAESMTAWPVTRRTSSGRYDAPDCAEPLTAPEEAPAKPPRAAKPGKLGDSLQQELGS
jgi:putative SOS response-associated peptidase YedK